MCLLHRAASIQEVQRCYNVTTKNFIIYLEITFINLKYEYILFYIFSVNNIRPLFFASLVNLPRLDRFVLPGMDRSITGSKRMDSDFIV
jgi:uncharacterized MAPEG superfamily protein